VEAVADLFLGQERQQSTFQIDADTAGVWQFAFMRSSGTLEVNCGKKRFVKNYYFFMDANHKFWILEL
jgi:hypothetical protein